jgi:anti-anti-sigma factor
MSENLQRAPLRWRWYCRAVLHDSHPQSTRPSDPQPPLLELLGGDGECLRAVVAGEIDFANASVLQTRISQACTERGARALILDLAGVEFMDSSGLRAILHLQRELADGRGGLVLLDPTAPVRGILTLTGLDRQLPAADTLEQAEALLAAEGRRRGNGTEGERADEQARGM